MHVLGGAFLAAFFYNFIPKVKGNGQLSFLLLLAVAIAWEVVEYALGIQAYGGDVKRFMLDSLQDITGAALAGICVLWRK